MKKSHEQLRRFTIIVQALSGIDKYLTPDELISTVRERCERYSIHFPEQRASALRQLQRCFKDIDDIMNITIGHKPQKGYYIKERDPESYFYRYEQLLTDFDILTSLQPNNEVSTYIIPEHHRPEGSKNIFPLIDAIKKRCRIEFDYTDIRENKTHHIVADPHYLKENQQRWYLIARNEKGNMRIYGIDRIYNLETDYGQTFSRDKDYDPYRAFNECYGIWNDPRMPVEEIILSYGRLDGEFLKRTPLHPSQKTIIDNDNEFRISLKLRITNDFIMALLSRAKTLTVIQPESLRSTISQICRDAYQRNSNK